MAEDITYDYVWRLYQKEKQSNQLLQTNKKFYEDIADYINSLPATDRQKANMEKLIIALFEKRAQKIFLYVAYRKPLPQPVSDPEQEFYIKLLEIAEKHNLDLSKTQNKSNKLLKSITDIPEIVLPSGKKFGPYRKDEIIDTQWTGPDLEYLLKNAVCESYNR
jgi:hypothetical protein